MCTHYCLQQWKINITQFRCFLNWLTTMKDKYTSIPIFLTLADNNAVFELRISKAFVMLLWLWFSFRPSVNVITIRII